MKPLDPEQTRYVQAARDKAWVLYEGKQTAHRSCGIAIAETFGVPTASYQALRKGGLTGRGECGAIVAGRLILGELLGDPDPTGPVTPELAAAMRLYDTLWPRRMNRGRAPGSDIICDTLVSPFEVFKGPERAAFCTHLAATVAECVAEVLTRIGKPSADAPAEATGARPTQVESDVLVFYLLDAVDAPATPESARFRCHWLTGGARDFAVSGPTSVPRAEFEALLWAVRDRGEISAAGYEELERLEAWIAAAAAGPVVGFRLERATAGVTSD